MAGGYSRESPHGGDPTATSLTNWNREHQWSHIMGCQREEAIPFLECFADEPKFSVFEVTKTAMDQP